MRWSTHFPCQSWNSRHTLTQQSLRARAGGCAEAFVAACERLFPNSERPVCENPKVRREQGREPKLVEVAAGDLRLAVWDWPGEEPALLLAHATSFHGRCWDAVIREFPGRRCLAFDARGHGRSSKPAPPYHWHVFREDLLAIVEHLGVSGAIGIGHSMGGHALAAVAAVRPDTFRALVLADPTIRGPEAYE